jgi:hypothetical protein
MISHSKKFIFIHIPKTGGSSIEWYISSYIKPDFPIFGYDEANKLHRQHATLEQLKNIYKIKIDDYFKFTVCRNPYERAVSGYFWFLEAGLLKDSTTFKDYLLIRNGCEKLNHLNSRRGRGDHFYTQLKYIEIEEKNKIDFVIRFEKLQQDFDIVCTKIGLPHQKLPHIKKTCYKHYTSYYDKETREIVEQKYANDIKYLGYEFGE